MLKWALIFFLISIVRRYSGDRENSVYWGDHNRDHNCGGCDFLGAGSILNQSAPPATFRSGCKAVGCLAPQRPADAEVLDDPFDAEHFRDIAFSERGRDAPRPTQRTVQPGPRLLGSKAQGPNVIGK
jgi:hypothetical protein